MIKFLIPLLLLAGCASSDLSGNDFNKPGVTSSQRMSDTQYCSAQARRTAAAAGAPQSPEERAERRNELFSMCMMDRGYRPI